MAFSMLLPTTLTPISVADFLNPVEAPIFLSKPFLGLNSLLLDPMDPLSISVSILAIVGATVSTIKAVRTVYKAPEELDSLLNDFTDTKFMVSRSLPTIG